jgi:predicted transcriptional regulator of viral defense system
MKEMKELYKQGLGEKEAFLLSELARLDKRLFTADDARKIVGHSPYLILHRLKKKKWILQLKRGFYAIVPLEIGPKGADSYIIHEFVIASYLADPYYIGFWSALNYHGLSDQIPATVFVATAVPKPNMVIMNSKYVFIQLKKDKFFGLDEIEIETRKVNISNKNKTIVDCLEHPEHAGGIDEVARAIYFGHQELDFALIKEYGLKIKNGAVFKRLGYILEATGLFEKYAATFQDVPLTSGYSWLDPLGPRQGKHLHKWKLLVNVDINPERWTY